MKCYSQKQKAFGLRAPRQSEDFGLTKLKLIWFADYLVLDPLKRPYQPHWQLSYVQPQPQPPQQPQQQQQPPQHEEPEAHGPAAAAAGAAAPEDADMEPAEIPEQHMSPTDVPPEPAEDMPVQQPAAAEVPEEPAKADAASSSMDTETSRVRLREKIESLAQQSYEDSCRLDGYRVPGKKPRFDWKTLDQTVQQQAEATPVPVETDPDELMIADDIFLLFEEDANDMDEIFQTEDTVYFVQKNKNAIVEARLSPDEKRQFDQAKDDCLKPWLQNYAWEAFPQTDVGEGEDCPLRFLLRWKLKDGNYVASARVIMQGFTHKDVL